jgi:hypothetical protein
MASRYTPSDAVGGYIGGVDAGQRQQANRNVLDVQAQEVQDKKVMDEYLQSGGDLNTPPGIEKALTDLKGKFSSSKYMQLSEYGKKAKESDIKMRSDLAKSDIDALTLRDGQLSRGLVYLSQPIEAWEKSKATRGEQQAGVDFDQAKKNIMEAASAEKLPNGQPVFPPSVLNQIMGANPQQLSALLRTTKYHKDLTASHLSESQIRRNEGLAAFDEARARAVEEGRPLGGGGVSAIAKIDGDVKKGLISPEDGEKMKAGIIAKTSKPGESFELTPEALDRTAREVYMFGQGSMPARTSEMNRIKIMNKAADIAKETGDTNEESIIRQQANKAARVALNDVTKRENMTGVFEKDAEKRLTFVQGLAKKADMSGVPALNRWLNAGRTQIAGDIDVNNLNSGMIALQAELARVLSGAMTNAATSDSARAEANEIINKNMSPEMIDSLVPNIRKELKFKMDAFKEQREQITESMKLPKADATRSAPESKVSAADQKVRDEEMGRVSATSDYTPERGGLKKAKSDLAQMDAAIKEAKGDTKSVMQTQRDRIARAVSELEKSPTPTKDTGGPTPTKNSKGWVLHVDKNGNKAYVGPKGEIEEVS